MTVGLIIERNDWAGVDEREFELSIDGQSDRLPRVDPEARLLRRVVAELQTCHRKWAACVGFCSCESGLRWSVDISNRTQY